MSGSDGNPGASTPREEQLLVTYGGPHNVWGNAGAVASIHRTNRLFDFLTTLVFAVLIGAVCALTTALAIFAPGDREPLVWSIAIVSWILAIGLGGFAAFQIRLSSAGIDIAGGKTLPRALAGHQPARRPKG